jgi:hypothetical protein
VVEVVGLELETHQPVIEPVSTRRRERKFPMQRWKPKSPHSGAINAKRLTEVFLALHQVVGATGIKTCDPLDVNDVLET